MNLLLWTTKVVVHEHHPFLQRLKTIGFDGVEIPVFEGRPGEYQELGRTLREIGLGTTAVTVMDAAANPISPEAGVRRAAVDRLKWVIDRCADAGVEVLCGPLHSALGVFSGRGPTDDERKWGADVFREIAPYADAAKVVLAVEYLNRFENYFLTTASSTLAWVNGIDHPACGLMWDSFHAHIEEKDVARAIESIRPRLVHVHISENDRGTPGSGQVNWHANFQALRKIQYDRWLVIEAFGRALPELAAATRVWRDLFPDSDGLCVEGLAFIRKQWASAGR